MSKSNKKSTSMRWYERNREAHNEKRRRQYHEDPSRREAILQRKRRNAAAPKELGPKEHWVGEQKVLLWTTGAVAAELGCSAQLIRSWQEKGYIPAPTIPGKHRLYTAKQRNTIEAIYSLIVHSQSDKFTEETVLLINELKEQW